MLYIPEWEVFASNKYVGKVRATAHNIALIKAQLLYGFPCGSNLSVQQIKQSVSVW